MSTSSSTGENSVYFDCCSDMSTTLKDNDTSRDDGPVSDCEEDKSTHPNVKEHHEESEWWLPAVDEAPQKTTAASGRARSPNRREDVEPFYERDFATSSAPTRRGTNRSNFHSTIQNQNQSHKRSASLARSGSRKSTHTTGDGREVPGSAFVSGAGTTGPSASLGLDEEEALKMRGAEAEGKLTEKQKEKVRKGEAKYDKQLSKVIKGESKTEKKALGIAIDELAELQKFQKQAIKEEGREASKHAKLLTTFKKAESVYLDAKRQYESALAALNAEKETLEALRERARDATESLQDKAVEIEGLRALFGVDEREREIKLRELKGTIGKRTSWLG